MNPVDVADIARGDPDSAMEAAKRIIGANSPDWQALLHLARDRSGKLWTRIAAIYALGFIVRDGSHPAGILAELLLDPREPEEVRSHAAEALGNIGARNNVGALRAVLGTNAPKEVINSVRYALGQIGSKP